MNGVSVGAVTDTVLAAAGLAALRYIGSEAGTATTGMHVKSIVASN